MHKSDFCCFFKANFFYRRSLSLSEIYRIWLQILTAYEIDNRPFIDILCNRFGNKISGFLWLKITVMNNNSLLLTSTTIRGRQVTISPIIAGVFVVLCWEVSPCTHFAASPPCPITHRRIFPWQSPSDPTRIPDQPPFNHKTKAKTKTKTTTTLVISQITTTIITAPPATAAAITERIVTKIIGWVTREFRLQGSNHLYRWMWR